MPDQDVFLERMTWPDVEARIAEGARRAVICAASSEQHGPQLPRPDLLAARPAAQDNACRSRNGAADEDFRQGARSSFQAPREQQDAAQVVTSGRIIATIAAGPDNRNM